MILNSMKNIKDLLHRPKEKQNIQVGEIIGENREKLSFFIVKDDGGCIPHVHVLIKPINSICCISLIDSNYFVHSNMKNCELTGMQKKLIDDFMHLKPEIAGFSSNYEFVCNVWNTNNNYILTNQKANIPNYSKL